MADEAEVALVKNVAGPKRVMVDGQSVDQYDLTDLIEADRYLGSKAAAKKGLGVRMTRVVPPGAV